MNIAPNTDQAEALDAARHLAAHGVPIFLAPPVLDDAGAWQSDGGLSGYRLPPGWADTPADPAALDAWRPGWAVCAVMGHTVDGLDIDPRHEGDATASGWVAAGMYPTSYGQQATPSGGWHELIAPLAVGSRDNAAPGVDVKGGRPDGTGRGFLFIAPTVKLSKATGELAAYRWTVAPNLDELDEADDSGTWLAERIRQLRPAAKVQPSTPADRAQFDTLDPAGQTRVRRYLDATSTRIATELAEAGRWPVGHRDDRGRGWQKLVSDAAYRLGSLARAPWTPWSLRDAWEALRVAVPPAMAASVPPAREWAAQAHRAAPAPFLPGNVQEVSAHQLAGLLVLDPPDTGPTLDDAPSGARVSTWSRVDLRATINGLLTGTLSRTRPSVGDVRGGAALFYRGKVNGLAGESGAGKTWTLLHGSRQTLDAGGSVVYVDHEDDHVGIVGRLLDLGADSDAIAARFGYFNPTERPTAADLQAVASLVAELEPELVVIDSTGEGLALHGANPNADEEVAEWFLRVPRRLATVAYGDQPGPAVVVLDHVTKADDGGLWPIGSQRKRAAISGAQYMQRTIRPFNKDAAGTAVLICAKDRHGNYRAGQRVAELNVTPTPDGPTITLDAVGTDRTAMGPFRPTGYMAKLSAALASAGAPLSRNGVLDLVPGRKDTKAQALAILVAEGYIKVTPAGRSHLHEHLRFFSEAAEDPGPTCEPKEWVSGSGSLGRDPWTHPLTGSGTQSGPDGTHLPQACLICGQPLHAAHVAEGFDTCPSCDRVTR